MEYNHQLQTFGFAFKSALLPSTSVGTATDLHTSKTDQ